MKQNKRQTGAAYEQAAGKYLEQQGYIILEYNYRCFFGEIDIIVQKDNCIIFCEVKYRKTESMGTPLEAVGARKQQTICKCAMYYLTERKKQGVACRFDVIGFNGGELIHIKNAFEG